MPDNDRSGDPGYDDARRGDDPGGGGRGGRVPPGGTGTSGEGEGGNAGGPGNSGGSGGSGGSGASSSAPVPAPTNTTPPELNTDTRVFREYVTIPPTTKVLSAVAAGTRESVTQFTSLSDAVKGAGSIAATMFGSGAPTLEEIPTAYAPKEPYNTVVVESESGHLIEVDDTPGAERVHVYHRSGSHIEMQPDGVVKYKTVKTRQDVTIGNHEILISGDWNIVVDGGYSLSVKNGEFIIEANDGAAINVKGKLKLSAEDIELKATSHIFLNAPKVDIGAIPPGGMPMMSLPGGVTINEKWPFDPTFVPRVNIPLGATALGSLKTAMGGTGTDEPLTLSTESKSKFKTTLNNAKDFTPAKKVDEIFKALTDFSSALDGKYSPVKQSAVLTSLQNTLMGSGTLDAAGEPAFSRLKEQPGVIPLSDPTRYKKGEEDRLIRARMFDSPEDVQNVESYNAHINLSVELGDYTQEERASAGIKSSVYTDDQLPAPEPPAYRGTTLSGGIIFRTANVIITGAGTKFTEDLQVGSELLIGSEVLPVQPPSPPGPSGPPGTPPPTPITPGNPGGLTPEQRQALIILRERALREYNIVLTDELFVQVARGINYTGGPITAAIIQTAWEWMVANLAGGILTVNQALEQLRNWARTQYNYTLNDRQIARIMTGIEYTQGPITPALLSQAQAWILANVPILRELEDTSDI